ncbi:MAG: hypothetical protein Tsb0020_16180 [Haliangiales bacterium]
MAWFRELLRHNAAILTVAWIVVWAAAALAGVRFETFDLSMWHLIDPSWLQAAPLENLYHLHSQPPLMNATLAALLALFGDGYVVACYIGFALMSLATVLAVDAVTCELCHSRSAGLSAGLLILLAPAMICYGHTLYHALPAAFVTTSGVWALRRAAERPSLARLSLVAALLLTASLLWAAFHPLWLLTTALWLWWSLPAARARVVATMAAPLAIVLLLIIKNGLVFGVWGLSSWSGMNLARVTVQQLPKAERDAAVAAGELSPVAGVRPFAALRWYRDAGVTMPEASGLPLLDSPLRPNQQRNLHHRAYIEIAQRYRDDAVRMICADPGTYLAAAFKGFWVLYLHPASDFHVVAEPNRALGAYATVYEFLVYGTPADHALPADMAPERGWSFWHSFVISGVFLKLYVLTSLLWGPVWVWRHARAGTLRSPDGVTAVALVGALWYVTLVCNLLELGENQRFRFTIEPITTILITVGLTALWQRWRAWRAAARASGERGADS